MNDYIRISVDIDWWNVRSWFKRTFWWKVFPSKFTGTYDCIAHTPEISGLSTFWAHRVSQRVDPEFLERLGKMVQDNVPHMELIAEPEEFVRGMWQPKHTTS